MPTDALLCGDISCANSVHFQQLNKYVADITEVCISAADSVIPHACRRQCSGRIAGWSEFVQPLRDKSLFWHKLWLECDRPRTGAVADCMRRTRAAYHYAIRNVKRDKDKIINDRLADSLLNNNTRDFWSEVKRIRYKKSGTTRVVDGRTEAFDIAKLFADKYRDLYSSVPYDVNDMQSIQSEVNILLKTISSHADCTINLHDLISAVSRLKAHKNDGGTGLTSDHIINAGNDCYVHMAMLFSAIIAHGTVPDSFLYSTIVPIPKGKHGNVSDSSNFRGITLSSIYGKLFDNIVLARYGDRLFSSELQFGFKAKSSTNLCSMVLKESIAYYVNNQCSVFCTFLDASKAFDRLKYCKLFKLLVDRQLPAPIIRVLINFYTGNYVRVAWCGIVSDYFLAINGVKQGGVLSPVLFCLYVDGLLVALSNAGVGCFIGDYFVGALAYADDIVLLAPSASALRIMLAICDDYANEYCISFNANKSKCLVVLPRTRRFLSDYIKKCTFYVGDNPIEYVDSFAHLGHVISNQLTDNDDILKRRSDFVGQANNVLCFFSKLSPCVKYRLFQSYCMSLYGCELWLLGNEQINDLCVAWRKSLRRIWGLPFKSHCYLLPLLSQCLPLADEICRRSLHFIKVCYNNDSSLVRAVTKYCLQFGRHSSIIGHNLLFCLQLYKCNIEDIINGRVNGIINNFVFKSFEDCQLQTACFVRELLLLRENTLLLPDTNLSRDELEQLIDFVCTC
jgi:hypothetical protein